MNKKKLIIIVVAAILAIAVITVGVIDFVSDSFNIIDFKKQKDKTDTSTPSSNSELVSSENIPAEADGNPIFTVESVEAKVGEKVKVPVTLKDNPGIMAMELTFKYDTASLKYTGYEKGDVLSDYEFADKNDTIKFVNLENNDVKKDGTLFYLEFEVLKGAKTSDILFAIGFDDITNYNEQLFKFTVNNGTVTIK